MEDAAAYPLLQLPPAVQENGRFTAAIIAALALHLCALVLGLYTPTARHMGEEAGSPDGVTVEIVDANELSSLPGQPPAAPAPPAMEAVPSPKVSAVAQQPPTEPAPDLKPSTSEEAPKEALKEAPDELPNETAKETPEPTQPPAPPAAKLQDLDPNLFKIEPQSQPKTDAKPAQLPPPAAKARPPAKPEKPEKPAQLSMTVPTPSFTSSNDMSGRSAGISRPAGITRSGLNDEFGRGVIRALRQTMPPNGRAARATVRFVLSTNGNILEVELVQTSGDPTLDRNVVFAVKQANFPIPATNLTALDRQFRVTYVYR
ncbi:MAG: TonB family protein [Hyphomicrobiaceae bacterium]